MEFQAPLATKPSFQGLKGKNAWKIRVGVGFRRRPQQRLQILNTKIVLFRIFLTLFFNSLVIYVLVTEMRDIAQHFEAGGMPGVIGKCLFILITQLQPILGNH